MISVILFDGDVSFNVSIREKFSGQSQVNIVTTTRDISELEMMLAKNRIDVLVFGPSISNADMTSFSEFISSKYPHVGIILVSLNIGTELLRDALRAGAKDVLPVSATKEQFMQSVEMAYQHSQRVRKAVGDLWPETQGTVKEVESKCHVVTFFGAKGGVGTTFVATNVGTGLVQQTEKNIILLDLDLQFGDVAVMLQLQPTHTIADAVSSIDRLDSELMRGFLSTHRSGLRVLAAPVLPDKADSMSGEHINKIIEVLQTMCDCLIIDTPACLDDRVLAALDNSHEIFLVTSLDMPSLKNTKLSLNMLEALQYGKEKIKLVLNRANSKVKLSARDVEHSLEKKISAAIPSNIMVPLSVNKGTPLVLDKPKAPVARSLFQFIDDLRNGNGMSGQDADRQMTKEH